MRSTGILNLTMLACAGCFGLFPTQASAQFNLPIPIPRFDMRPPGYHSAPSHHSTPQPKHEDSNGSSAEKDATQAEPNAGASAERQQQQQQVSGPARDAVPAPTPHSDENIQPVFAPSR
jgi:hypothetical protein